MRQIIFLILIQISISGFSQVKLNLVGRDQISELMEYKGDFITCYKWMDSSGTNFLILSQTKIIKPPKAIEASKKYELANYNGKIDTIYDSEEADFREKEIYAYHYIQSSGSITLFWKLLDFIRECPLDLTIEYLTDKPIITDLDKNGICETWLVYWLGCRSDVSAINMKLILHIGKDKYAIRGTRRIRWGSDPDQADGGKMQKDDSFKKLPSIINDYSTDLWNKYKNEN